MKKINNALKPIFALLIILVTSIACDKDFSDIGSDIVGGENFETNSAKYPVITFSQIVDPVQTNALPINVLGVYNDPFFGVSTASFLTQVVPETFNPSFPDYIAIDDIFLNAAYFSTRTEVDEDNNGTYELDSIFGNMPMKLTGYRSNHFLRDLDPNSEFEDAQLYYSNELDPITGTIPSGSVEGDLLFEIDSFEVDDSEIVVENDEIDPETNQPISEERFTPRVRIPLGVLVDANDPDDPDDDEYDFSYWQTTIFDKEGEPELSNASNFRDYFRGVYIKAEPINGDGTMFIINFDSSNANITINYSRDIDADADGDTIPDFADVDVDGDGIADNTINAEDEDGDGIHDIADADFGDNNGAGDDNNNGILDAQEEISGTYIINFAGNSINLFDDDFNLALADGDEVNGDETLYLKGGEGSVAIVNLFDGVSFDDNPATDNAFETFKKEFVEVEDNLTGNFVRSKRLINEANLVFYVNQDLVDGEEPDRVYLYDLKNKRTLIDYSLDPTVNTFNPNESRIQHLGPLEREGGDADGEGIRYKLRITEHLNNLLLRDSTNVKLGLAVTSNINIENTLIQYDLLTDDEGEQAFDKLPVGSIISPRGTVLHGSNSPQQDKRVELEIFYTEPDN